ncbi:multiple sugar transport system substrate-binding protein [Rhizobium tibeticum]|uniref:Multiple sugar transport system substrate-binding protein n=1 Tax=Rhizobium tibeticum TaxID=501024 RepID=A0A1H8WR72_9HYPH|nr:extracellular solute-binding protein [Rhizobium tibeticum]SEI21537.1 sn-glycerol-3-phosphate-binding periplasmic protein UgpB precursor [Rhizobium tibeticum]SEP29927.1 multiple sugar transport system substrate-binding protein [Rhizobium tibeticum]
MKEHPGVKIKFRLSPPSYAEANLVVTRGALTGDLPDVYFSGFGELESMVDTLAKRQLAVDLGPFITTEGSDWASSNFDKALLNLGRVGETQYGLPFNASTPVIFYNADLVKRSGHDPEHFPKDWDGIIKLAQDPSARRRDRRHGFFRRRECRRLVLAGDGPEFGRQDLERCSHWHGF